MMNCLMSILQKPFSYVFSSIYLHYKSSQDRKQKYDQNYIQLITISLIMFLYTIYVIIAQLSFSYPITILFSLGFALIFILLGSKIITQFDSVLVVFLSISSPLIISRFQNNIFISYVMITMGPIFTLLLTNSHRCFFVSILMHLVDINTKFKENFLSKLATLEYKDHEEFLKQAFTTISAQMVVSMIIYAFMERISHKSIVEIIQKEETMEQAKLDHCRLLEEICSQITHPLRYLYGIIDFSLPQIPSYQGAIGLKQVQTSLKLFKNDMDNLLVSENLKFQGVDIQPIPTRTYDWLAEIWTISCDLLKEKGITGLFKVQRKVPSLLYLDSRRVQQIILNLLQFIIDTTKKGMVNLSIEWLEWENVTDKCFEPIPYNYEEEGVFEKKEALHVFDFNGQEKNGERFQIFKSKEREIKFEHCKFDQRIPFGTLKLTVRNTGPGLNDKQVNELFNDDSQETPDLFDTVEETAAEGKKDETIKRKPLKLSRDLCKRMDGDIRVYSKKDIGITFMACIPIPMYHSWQMDAGIRGRVAKLKQLKLKMMMGTNDSGLMNQINTYLVNLEGYVATRATNVSEFFLSLAELSMESHHPIDIVMIDLNMPHLDLPAFCERLRNIERKSQLGPLYIVLTGDTEMNDAAKQLLNANHPGYVNGYLKKSFEFYEFLEMLLNVTCK